MNSRDPDRFVQAVWLAFFLSAALGTGLIAAWFAWRSATPW